MKITGLDGKSFTVPDPKAEPTQALLGEIYDELDSALDFMECVYQASLGPDHKREITNPLRAVLEVAQKKVTAAKDKLHDTISWCS